MDIKELKALLYQSYALGFESGVNSGNHYDMEASWGRQKYFFEKDIETEQANTPDNTTECESGSIPGDEETFNNGQGWA